MRPSIPPRLATWLFNRLGPRNVELAGDLIEEYKSGRSAAWYWRQVLIAITVGFRTEVSSHKFLAAKAVAISWIVMYVGIFNRLLLIPDPSRLLVDRAHPHHQRARNLGSPHTTCVPRDLIVFRPDRRVDKPEIPSLRDAGSPHFLRIVVRIHVLLICQHAACRFNRPAEVPTLSGLSSAKTLRANCRNIPRRTIECAYPCLVTPRGDRLEP